MVWSCGGFSAVAYAVASAKKDIDGGLCSLFSESSVRIDFLQ